MPFSGFVARQTWQGNLAHLVHLLTREEYRLDDQRDRHGNTGSLSFVHGSDVDVIVHASVPLARCGRDQLGHHRGGRYRSCVRDRALRNVVLPVAAEEARDADHGEDGEAARAGRHAQQGGAAEKGRDGQGDDRVQVAAEDGRRHLCGARDGANGRG